MAKFAVSEILAKAHQDSARQGRGRNAQRSIGLPKTMLSDLEHLAGEISPMEDAPVAPLVRMAVEIFLAMVNQVGYDNLHLVDIYCPDPDQGLL